MSNDFVFDVDQIDLAELYSECFDAYECWDLNCINVEEDYDAETGDDWLYCDSYTDLSKCPLLRRELNRRRLCFEI